jgi:ABC-type multidrug transport system ATPase subunit
MEKVIEIRELTKIYPNGRGIEDVNLDIYRGDIFGFLGPNGAGKTTAMKIMTGLIIQNGNFPLNIDYFVMGFLSKILVSNYGISGFINMA